ncbi:hypothetical protein GUJ93_ZPchr0002g24320 [Zizania palustris]|uniref:Uncharacterized protein n=1 Tax=Zizania palustris TaxID=103762 RepID=A0A8J5RJI2_ZIZPA|nr:hypothetical protein GUJ93_ZPchr0002g24320 [Zizania palustris]
MPMQPPTAHVACGYCLHPVTPKRRATSSRREDCFSVASAAALTTPCAALLDSTESCPANLLPAGGLPAKSLMPLQIVDEKEYWLITVAPGKIEEDDE